jgi:CheY-like chemotaxis protein
MDGMETVKIIRGMGYARPIVALTANALLGQAEIFLANGADDFISKPIDIRQLNASLNKFIRDKQPPDVIQAARLQKDANAAEMSLPPLAPLLNEYAAIDIEGVDVQLGLLLNGGTMTPYMKTLAVFYDDGLRKADQLRDSLRSNDIKLYTTLVHWLKSASMNIGARQVSNFAKTLELAGTNGSNVYILENNERFIEELETLLKNINFAITDNKDEKTELDANEFIFLKKTLTELKNALADMETGQVKLLLKELETGTWNKKSNEAIGKLSQFILLFEYEEAIALIDELF